MIRINSIDYSGSVCDGPGIRTVIFVQGCDRNCFNCHNPSTWEMEAGRDVDEEELANELQERSMTKKVTISGGEPLLQRNALIKFLIELRKRDFDITLYTSYELEEIPKNILALLDYIKVGRYIDDLRTTVQPYIGSTNQRFIRLEKYQGM